MGNKRIISNRVINDSTRLPQKSPQKLSEEKIETLKRLVTPTEMLINFITWPDGYKQDFKKYVFSKKHQI